MLARDDAFNKQNSSYSDPLSWQVGLDSVNTCKLSCQTGQLFSVSADRHCTATRVDEFSYVIGKLFLCQCSEEALANAANGLSHGEGARVNAANGLGYGEGAQREINTPETVIINSCQM